MEGDSPGIVAFQAASAAGFRSSVRMARSIRTSWSIRDHRTCPRNAFASPPYRSTRGVMYPFMALRGEIPAPAMIISPDEYATRPHRTGRVPHPSGNATPGIRTPIRIPPPTPAELPGIQHSGHDLAHQSVFTHETVDFMSPMSGLGDDLVRKDGFARKERTEDGPAVAKLRHIGPKVDRLA